MTDVSDDKKIDAPTQSFYADRIIGMALGVGVSKLILGNEDNTPTLTLVMPTMSLMEALKNLQKSFGENSDIKQQLIEQLDNLKERLIQ